VSLFDQPGQQRQVVLFDQITKRIRQAVCADELGNVEQGKR